MKKLNVYLGMLGIQFISASALAFVPYPINCQFNRSRAAVQLQGTLYVQMEGNSTIKGTVYDGLDSAELRCSETSNPKQLICNGVWQSDGSEAIVHATLETYSPFVTVKRAVASYGLMQISGMVCF